MHIDEVQILAELAHQDGKKVVLVTGVFDILHSEHSLFLEKARALGDVLLVGIECDERVKKMKGQGRPIHSAVVRLGKLEKWGIAAAVFILPEEFDAVDDYRLLLNRLQPSLLAVSSHSPHLDSKRQLMAEVGGEVVIVHQHNPAVSTTILLEKRRSG